MSMRPGPCKQGSGLPPVHQEHSKVTLPYCGPALPDILLGKTESRPARSLVPGRSRQQKMCCPGHYTKTRRKTWCLESSLVIGGFGADEDVSIGAESKAAFCLIFQQNRDPLDNAYGQSSVLIILWSTVQVRPGPPIFSLESRGLRPLPVQLLGFRSYTSAHLPLHLTLFCLGGTRAWQAIVFVCYHAQYLTTINLLSTERNRFRQ